jgi:Zn-dependent protease
VGGIDWAFVLTVLVVLVPSVILHEVSHGALADRLGDDTARRAGRLTLNPLPHIDPFGTILLPILLSLSGFGAFGYAKPVPVDVRRLRDPRQHSLYVSLVGPAVNLVIAALAALALRTFYVVDVDGTRLLEGGRAAELLLTLGVVNVILAVFNLLPIPPLDGSAVVERLLPTRWWPTWLKLRQYSMGVLILVVLLVPGLLTRVFGPALDLWVGLL